MYKYAVACLDAHGNGRNPGEPFVRDGLASFEEAERFRQRIGGVALIGDACVFCYRIDKRPEAFNMAFVEAHRMGEWC